MSEFLSSLHPALVCIIVCLAKIIEISIQSLKTCMMVKGQRAKAAMLGFLECVIWGLVISTIISTLGDNLLLLLFYCVGYASGLFIGSSIESRLALGTSNLQLIAGDKEAGIIVSYLNEKNYGYTIFEGRGAKEKMNMILIILPRKEIKNVLREVTGECDGKVFVVASDVSKFVGGHGMLK